MGRRCILSLICVFALCTFAILPVKAEGEQTYIVLTYGSMRFEYTDSFIEPTDHLVAQQIFERKINAPLNEKLALVLSKVRSGASYKDAMLWCFPLLSRVVSRIKSEVDTPPTDSEIRFDPNKKPIFEITSERAGVEVLEERLYMDIYCALSSGVSTIRVPVRYIPAAVGRSDNIKLTHLRASFSTDCSLSSNERKHNIALALSKLNGTSLCCGEELSFNRKVGKRTSNNGFKEAKIIVGGKYVLGVGGGVCQASTTLYNAALIGGLTVEEVHRHTLQSSYIEPSFDAMVNSGSSDLRIKNEGDAPVFICAYCDGNRAYVRIYGKRLKYTIKRSSEVTFTGETPGYDKTVDYEHKYFAEDEPSGTTKTVSYSHPELHSKGYLLYYDLSGALVEKKLIRSDKYMSVKGVVAVSP